MFQTTTSTALRVAPAQKWRLPACRRVATHIFAGRQRGRAGQCSAISCVDSGAPRPAAQHQGVPASGCTCWRGDAASDTIRPSARRRVRSRNAAAAPAAGRGARRPPRRQRRRAPPALGARRVRDAARSPQRCARAWRARSQPTPARNLHAVSPTAPLLSPRQSSPIPLTRSCRVGHVPAPDVARAPRRGSSARDGRGGARGGRALTTSRPAPSNDDRVPRRARAA